MQNPGEVHHTAAKRVLLYLKGTPGVGLVFKNQPWTLPGLTKQFPVTKLVEFTDTDWATDFDSLLSTTCYLCLMAGGVLSFWMVKQKTHSMSRAESELIAMSSGA